MATVEPSYGSSSALTVTNLHSLANNLLWQSAGQDNATDKAVFIELFVTIVGNSTGGSATGYCNVFIAGSIDGGTDYSGGASGSEGAYTVGTTVHKQNLQSLGQVYVPADATNTGRGRFLVPSFTVPRHYSVVLENKTGAALAAAGSAVEIAKHKVTSA